MSGKALATQAQGGESHGVSSQEAERGEYRYVPGFPFYSIQDPSVWQEATTFQTDPFSQLNLLPATFVVCLLSDFKSDSGDIAD